MAKSKKFERCVKEVKKQDGKYNSFAVCHASLNKRTKRANKKMQQLLLGDKDDY